MPDSRAQEGIRYTHLPETPPPSTWTTVADVQPVPVTYSFEDDRIQLLRTAGVG